jgi:hypothetical protein
MIQDTVICTVKTCKVGLLISALLGIRDASFTSIIQNMPDLDTSLVKKSLLQPSIPGLRAASHRILIQPSLTPNKGVAVLVGDDERGGRGDDNNERYECKLDINTRET